MRIHASPLGFSEIRTPYTSQHIPVSTVWWSKNPRKKFDPLTSDPKTPQLAGKTIFASAANPRIRLT
jgi:hypothetical protein